MAINREQYYDQRETMSVQERQEYQRLKLQEALEGAYRHCSAARNLMDFVGMSPSDFETPADLEKLPITRKTDLIEMQKANPPFGGLLMVPPQDVERIFISPGPIYEYQPSGIEWFARSFLDRKSVV
jgi:phenylacetate-CoA ligase